ncbi:MAG: type II toxin-antitoxin system prevent-host-death family antitoxin [Candidatus Caenarcaniphilales bacterium]|nr:type II toxin-antitoxin system prevent-host-death family antitoxin [Candidatus Caenarcaniphilales bacterium]
MKFISSSELSEKTNIVLKSVLEEQDVIVVTKNGKPIAIISPIVEDNTEDRILIKHLGVHKSPSKAERKEARSANEVFRRIQEQASKNPSKSRKRPSKDSG